MSAAPFVPMREGEGLPGAGRYLGALTWSRIGLLDISWVVSPAQMNKAAFLTQHGTVHGHLAGIQMLNSHNLKECRVARTKRECQTCYICQPKYLCN